MSAVSSTGFYRTTKWRKFRENVLQRDGYLCQRCLQYGLLNPADIVHHKIELTLDNVNDDSVAFNSDNCISVCFECHKEIHNHCQHSRYKVDENGDIIEGNE